MNFALPILILSIIFFTVVGYYFRRSRVEINEERMQLLQEEKLQLEKIEKDENRAKDELIEAHKKAKHILFETETIAINLIEELEKVLGKRKNEANIDLPLEDNFEIELGSLSDKIKNNYVNRIRQLLTSLEKFEYQKAQNIEDFAEEQQASTDTNLQKMRIEQLEKMRERIELYKKEELALFDQKVKKVIDEAAIEVLGHQLTHQEHNELIEKALKRAQDAKKI